MGRYILERSQVIPRPRAEVFPFFAEARNLETITPNFMRFRIVNPGTIEMREGTIIDYRLRIYGLPQRWRSRIVNWSPPEYFSDLQEAGPYHYWLHTHSFVALQNGGTLMQDHLEYELPFGIIGDLVHALLVQRTLRRIFAYRRERVTALLVAEGTAQRTET
jgi:ligand-binding SRPBCC domain-containing protein